MKIADGFHSKFLLEAVARAWKTGETLIVRPPHIKSFEVPEVVKKWKPSEQPILGVFTSGTVNGTPKLVFYSKTNIESSLTSIRSLFDVKRIEKIFCYPQPTHTFGLILGYVQ